MGRNAKKLVKKIFDFILKKFRKMYLCVRLREQHSSTENQTHNGNRIQGYWMHSESWSKRITVDNVDAWKFGLIFADNCIVMPPI